MRRIVIVLVALLVVSAFVSKADARIIKRCSGGHCVVMVATDEPVQKTVVQKEAVQKGACHARVCRPFKRVFARQPVRRFFGRFRCCH